MLYPWMRVRQIIDYQASFYWHWNDELVDRLLVEWKLDPWAKVQPLSVGQQQKLSILLAIGHEPDLLVLDDRPPHSTRTPAAVSYRRFSISSSKAARSSSPHTLHRTWSGWPIAS